MLGFAGAELIGQGPSPHALEETHQGVIDGQHTFSAACPKQICLGLGYAAI